MREMRVLAIGLDVQRDAPILLLQETEVGRRLLPVWVGMPEAAAIEVELRHVPAARPRTHHLIGDVLALAGRSLTRVCITALRDSVFHAELVLDDGTRISARVSDAVALALHTGAPVGADEAVLDEAALAETQVVGLDGPADDATEIERFRRFIDVVSPEDFED